MGEVLKKGVEKGEVPFLDNSFSASIPNPSLPFILNSSAFFSADRFSVSKMATPPAPALKSRFFRGNRAAYGGAVNIAVDRDERREHGLGTKSGPLLYAAAYCVSSCIKLLSSYNFNAGISLMFYQVCYLSQSECRMLSDQFSSLQGYKFIQQ
ncbi:hypothetical protein Pint_05780 [Pistacia integerrima]|uniref:Uncharacterized protein n=1 Tax=Pistacia integerrima TaxID=434235 RepID=A0ACC0Z7F8_9ROSI|nr:hypothetical protein Pint_05780 [Pistacia integerrima]